MCKGAGNISRHLNFIPRETPWPWRRTASQTWQTWSSKMVVRDCCRVREPNEIKSCLWQEAGPLVSSSTLVRSRMFIPLARRLAQRSLQYCKVIARLSPGRVKYRTLSLYGQPKVVAPHSLPHIHIAGTGHISALPSIISKPHSLLNKKTHHLTHFTMSEPIGLAILGSGLFVKSQHLVRPGPPSPPPLSPSLTL